MSGWSTSGAGSGKNNKKLEGKPLGYESNTPGFDERSNAQYHDIAGAPVFTKKSLKRDGVPAVFKQGSHLLRLRIEHNVSRLKFLTIDSLTSSLSAEREAGTYFHFVPLIFGIANAVYFSAPSEPILFVALSCCLILALIASRLQSHGKLWLMLCAMALFFGGLSAGKMRTQFLNSNALTHQITGQVSGTVIEVSQNQRGAPRYLIAPQSIEGVPNDKLPSYIRLSSASKHRAVLPGEHMAGLARLRAISGPAYPGSFDFSFNSWFNGLGASGFFMGKPVITKTKSKTSSLPFGQRYQIAINQFRVTIASRIRGALRGESGDVAVALIVGDRTGIDKTTQQSLRRSGLAHVLAISGMHMALVSLTMVWSVRFLFAFNSNLAALHPIKKWAAMAGFFTASSYLAISGMAVATQRAWIMISIIMLAAMLLRKSITLRGVAIAAMLILILQPESILSPGFQMSFAAVAAIVAAYEWLDGFKARWRFGTNSIVRFFATLIFTSLIAGLATSLFAAYHFHRIAPMGVATNLLAMPLVSIVIMPMALAAMLLMPFGFEHLALIPMGAGIEQVIIVSDYVNERSFSGVTGQLGNSVLPLSFIGLFLLTMLKTRLRISGLLVLMISAYFWQTPDTPDILVSEDGRAIAIRNENDQLAMLYPRRNKFVRDIWLRAYSNDVSGEQPPSPPERINVKLKGFASTRDYRVTPRKKSDFSRVEYPNNKSAKLKKMEKLSFKAPLKLLEPSCSKDHCVAYTRQGALVFVVYAPKLLQHACNFADILLAPKLRWVNCKKRQPALIIKRGQMEEYGAHAIYLKTKKQSPAKGVETVEPKSGKQVKSNEAITQTSPERENEASIQQAKHSQPDEPEQPKVEPQWMSPAVVHIVKIETAIKSTARPWNHHRAGRAKYRQD